MLLIELSLYYCLAKAITFLFFYPPHKWDGNDLAASLPLAVDILFQK